MMSAKNKKRNRAKLGEDNLDQLLARGHRFHTVSLENCQLVVLARNASEAIGVFRTWFEQVWQDLIYYGYVLVNKDFRITMHHQLPPRGSQFAVFAGHRGGYAQVHILSL
jgi:hypothetical protein